jgi:CBS domain-containing protein
MRCQELMTGNPSYCLKSDKVADAAQVMKERQVGPVPVVENTKTKKVAGILTDRDIAVKVVAEGRDPNETVIGEVMSRDVVTCRPEDDAQRAIDAMAEHRVRRILVVDGDGSLRGIISQADVATRVAPPETTGEVVREISRPS